MCCGLLDHLREKGESKTDGIKERNFGSLQNFLYYTMPEIHENSRTFHISFLNTFIRYLILSLTLLFWSQRAMVSGFRRWWVKCVLLMEILQITAVFLALVLLPGKGNVYLIG